MKITSHEPSPTPLPPPRPTAVPAALNFQPRNPVRYKQRPASPSGEPG